VPVAGVAERFSRAGLAVDAVLGTEQFEQPVASRALALKKNADGRTAPRIGAGGIGDQPDMLALQRGEIGFLELVDAERNRAHRRPGQPQEKPGRHRDEEKEGSCAHRQFRRGAAGTFLA
jgi:hypothetical protein